MSKAPRKETPKIKNIKNKSKLNTQLVAKLFQKVLGTTEAKAPIAA